MVICRAIFDDLDDFSRKLSLRHYMLNQYLFAALTGFVSFHTAFRIRVRLQIVDMAKTWISHSLAQNIEDSLNGMDGSAVVCKTTLDGSVSRFDK